MQFFLKKIFFSKKMYKSFVSRRKWMQKNTSRYLGYQD